MNAPHWLMFCASAAILVGCDSGPLDQAGPESAGAQPAEAPRELVTKHGRRLLRQDLWDKSELAHAMAMGRPTSGPPTVEILANQMRAQTITSGGVFIEVEPNYELARKILNSPVPGRQTNSPELREGRTIKGSDTRNLNTNTTAYNAGATIGFQEAACSGTLIGNKTAITAAHCIYETRNPEFTDGWMCNNASSNPSGCANYPRWRWGANGTTGATDWMWCSATLPTAFINLTNPATNSEETWWDYARWDYAIVNFSGCTTPGATTGWAGTWVFDDTTILAVGAYSYGYPRRATCPSESIGTDTDCASGTYRFNGASAPFTGGQQWGDSASDLEPGSSQAGHTIMTTLDMTIGQSGSGLYYASGSSRWIIGNWSLYNLGTGNVFHRWNDETYNFFSNYSTFPEE